MGIFSQILPYTCSLVLLCPLFESTLLDLELEVQLCEWGQSFLLPPVLRSKHPISHSKTDLLDVVITVVVVLV